MQLREQAERFGLEVHDKNVDSVDLSTRPFAVTVEGETHHANAVIVCTGAESIWLGAEGEDAQKGRGISTCATRTGPSSAKKKSSWSAVVILRGGSHVPDAFCLQGDLGPPT